MRTLLDAIPALVALALPLASRAAPAPAEKAPPAAVMPGYIPGEGFAFTFSVGAIEAGRARMSVGEPSWVSGPAGARGRRLVAVQGDAHNAPWLSLLARLDAEYKSILDADLLATRTVAETEHGLRERHVDIQLERAGSGSRVKLDLEKPNHQQHSLWDFTSTPLDPVAALFTLRAAPLRTGDRLQFTAFDGPAFYRASATATRREKVEYGGGSVDAIRIDIEAVRVNEKGRELGENTRHAIIWLSDDARRIPYRMAGDTDFGRCELELVTYREGTPPGKAAPPSLRARRGKPAIESK